MRFCHKSVTRCRQVVDLLELTVTSIPPASTKLVVGLDHSRPLKAHDSYGLSFCPDFPGVGLGWSCLGPIGTQFRHKSVTGFRAGLAGRGGAPPPANEKPGNAGRRSGPCPDKPFDFLQLWKAEAWPL